MLFKIEINYFSNVQAHSGGAYDIYTKVSSFILWINQTILANGGMSSCGYTLAASPVTSNSILQGMTKDGRRLRI